jgi:hypothetical protein
MYQGRNMEQVEQDPGEGDTAEVASEDDPEDNVVKRHIKRLYRKTKEDAHRIFLKTKRSFKDFVARW